MVHAFITKVVTSLPGRYKIDSPSDQAMAVSREEFDTVVNELRNALAQNAADLKIQFERIAQIQAELDSNRLALEKRSRRKKATPVPPAIAADEPR